MRKIEALDPVLELNKAVSALVNQEAEKMQGLEPHVKGSLQQRARLLWAADWGMRTSPGDLLEIGCLHGATTCLLAEHARDYGRRVLCVDPWVHLPIYGPEDPYEVFRRNMEPWWDMLDVVKLESQHLHAIETIQERRLCFAFVDGLHTYDACLTDIQTVSHTEGFIAVDDILWSEDLMRAFHKGAELVGRTTFHHPHCREGWLVP